MANITYFIGAGASFHSLPLLKTMHERMVAFRNYINELGRVSAINHNEANKFVTDFDNLIIQEKGSTFIDAYANELYHSDHSAFIKLKFLLSSYLLFEQFQKSEKFILKGVGNKNLEFNQQESVNTDIDKRYRTFWAENTLQNGQLRPEIKIISWNYDMQFELSYSRFKNCDLKTAFNYLGSSFKKESELDLNKFYSVKLNGVAGLFHDHSTDQIYSIFKENIPFNKGYNRMSDEYMSTIVKLYTDNENRLYETPLLYFAWEKEVNSDPRISDAANIMATSTDLVIIGYSFQRLNKEIDRYILNHCNKLQRVYIQCESSDFEEILEKLASINSRYVSITKHINNLDTFYSKY